MIFSPGSLRSEQIPNSIFSRLLFSEWSYPGLGLSRSPLGCDGPKGPHQYLNHLGRFFRLCLHSQLFSGFIWDRHINLHHRFQLLVHDRNVKMLGYRILGVSFSEESIVLHLSGISRFEDLHNGDFTHNPYKKVYLKE